MTNIDIKKDRLRYTKNTTSATLAYLAILFNVFYFVSIYNSDVGNFYYDKLTSGLSVICNLLFLLFTFLASEGVKNYKMSFNFVLLFLGGFQIVRLFGTPHTAHTTQIILNNEQITVMSDKQYAWVCICLIISAFACFASAGIGMYKSTVLRNYEKQLGN